MLFNLFNCWTGHFYQLGSSIQPSAITARPGVGVFNLDRSPQDEKEKILAALCGVGTDMALSEMWFYLDKIERQIFSKGAVIPFP